MPFLFYKKENGDGNGRRINMFSIEKSCRGWRRRNREPEEVGEESNFKILMFQPGKALCEYCLLNFSIY